MDPPPPKVKRTLDVGGPSKLKEESKNLQNYKQSRLLKSCYLSRDDHNRKIRTRKHRTDVGKYYFVYRKVKSLLKYFSCKLNTFRKRVKNVVTSKGI